jgi:hypothetical protein
MSDIKWKSLLQVSNMEYLKLKLNNEKNNEIRHSNFIITILKKYGSSNDNINNSVLKYRGIYRRPDGKCRIILYNKETKRVYLGSYVKTS